MPPVPTIPHNGAAIRAIRLIRGYSVADLARRVAVTSSALSNIERENKRLSVTLANRIARELCVDLAAITCRHDHQPRTGGRKQ
jgi:transcriptional regulator with XRE-family HTH domain